MCIMHHYIHVVGGEMFGVRRRGEQWSISPRGPVQVTTPLTAWLPLWTKEIYQYNGHYFLYQLKCINILIERECSVKQYNWLKCHTSVTVFCHNCFLFLKNKWVMKLQDSHWLLGAVHMIHSQSRSVQCIVCVSST